VIRKYFDIFGGFFRASAIADLEYRLNIVVKVLTDFVWYAAQLSVFEVLFQNVGPIAGWNLGSTRVFMAVLFVVDSIWMLLLSENLDKLSDRVRKGELDLLLTKPVNSQFMMSFQKVSTPYVVNIAFTIGFFDLGIFPAASAPRTAKTFVFADSYSERPDGDLWHSVCFLGERVNFRAGRKHQLHLVSALSASNEARRYVSALVEIHGAHICANGLCGECSNARRSWSCGSLLRTGRDGAWVDLRLSLNAILEIRASPLCIREQLRRGAEFR
jgi:ABC-2 family transporter protein